LYQKVCQFLARDSIYAIPRYMLLPVRLSVCLCVHHVGDQSKTVVVKIMQLSPQSSPMTVVSLWLTYCRIPTET